MRVIAGTARSVPLVTPDGATTRPTADRAREALFSILGSRVAGARVLDIFAGSGAVGIEAISRGAHAVTFVDSSPAAIAAIRKNLAKTNLNGEVLKAKAHTAIMDMANAGRTFDIIFADPPYQADAGAILQSLDSARILENSGILIYECEDEQPPHLPRPFTLRHTATKKYGRTVFHFYEKTGGTTYIFPGSFDPPHPGHFDIARRAALLCDKLVVAIGENPDKTPFLPVAQRIEKLREGLPPSIEVTHYTGTTIGFARQINATAIIRGLRGETDFPHEMAMAQTNREAGGIETVFIPAASWLAGFTSTKLRQEISERGEA